jgi:hypothetical protein
MAIYVLEKKNNELVRGEIGEIRRRRNGGGTGPSCGYVISANFKLVGCLICGNCFLKFAANIIF